jgi:hypothetical protein
MRGGDGRRFNSRSLLLCCRRFFVILLLILSLVLLLAWPAFAGHTWYHYRNIFDQGSSDYGGYAWTDADQKYDFGFAQFKVERSGSVIRNQEAVCGYVNEGCDYIRTSTVYWSQTQSTATSAHCGLDIVNGNHHKMPGNLLPYRPCGDNGVEAHTHSVKLG